MIDDGLYRMTTFDGRRPSMKEWDDLCWRTILESMIVKRFGDSILPTSVRSSFNISPPPLRSHMKENTLNYPAGSPLSSGW